ncbi:MAG TPA: FecR family protein, partial [Blastocatellia bacterium]|nr:FecR family protein [Blastocatellia bacterium]
MLSWRIRRDDLAWSSNLSIARHLIQTLMVCGWVLISLAVQGQIPQARITSVTGAVTLQRSGAAIPLPLKRGELLQLSDVIDTGTGSVVIAMHDGSQVTVYPGSRVLLKDFRSVTSWRDLLEVVVGRVRVKINHYGKRPNPYRVYSPIASIAVRGTEFLVLVESNTETRVLVFEGLVEVSSLISPGQSALVKPGRNVVVRPDGGLDLVSTAPRNNQNLVYSASALRDAYDEHDRNYARYRAPRYLAFSDSHLDSLQNPAYATEFRERSGRLYLMPSFIARAEPGFFDDQIDPKDRSQGKFNYAASPQLSYFTPLGSRFVVGGGATLAKTDLRGNGADSFYQDGIYERYDGTAKFTTLNLSLIAARRFGEAERTSVGLKFDYIDDQSMYAVTTSESDNSSGHVERGDSRVRRLGFSAGLTHDFGGDKKLGLYYHYDTGTVRGQVRSTYFYSGTESGSTRYAQINSANTKPK